MMNKKGLSDIVATVLIVLLALAAVAIVWGFLRPMFDSVASSTDLKSKCLGVEVQPVLCTYTPKAESSGAFAGTFLVTAKGINKAGEASILRGALNLKSGATYSTHDVTPADLLNTQTFLFGANNDDNEIAFGNATNDYSTLEDYQVFKDFTLAGVVTGDTEGQEACTSETVACTFVPPTQGCSDTYPGLCATQSTCEPQGSSSREWCSTTTDADYGCHLSSYNCTTTL